MRVFWDDSAWKKEADPLKRIRYTDEQIAFALRRAEASTRVSEVCRKIGVLEQRPFDCAQGRLFYRWKKRCAGVGVAELRLAASAWGAVGLGIKAVSGIG